MSVDGLPVRSWYVGMEKPSISQLAGTGMSFQSVSEASGAAKAGMGESAGSPPLTAGLVP